MTAPRRPVQVHDRVQLPADVGGLVGEVIEARSFGPRNRPRQMLTVDIDGRRVAVIERAHVRPLPAA